MSMIDEHNEVHATDKDGRPIKQDPYSLDGAATGQSDDLMATAGLVGSVYNQDGTKRAP